MNFEAEYQRWLANVDDLEIKAELEAVKGHLSEIEDRFYRELEFGTGGLRGVLGVGTNRMNLYMVRKATQGYSDYLNANFEQPSVSIAYDSRIHSEDFARTAACVFAANNICVHLYAHLMPTPSLSFAVRDLCCSGGIVITASHNPAKYNGYKVYGADGCQITTEAAREIQSCIDKVDVFTDVRQTSFEKALADQTIRYISADTIERYLAAVSTASVLPKDINQDVSIVYTPLNGAGISCVPQCLKVHGFTNITIPTEQGMPDGNFPTCPYPNPEIREALEVGLRWARETGSDLLLATDPDCDRVGVAVKCGEDYTLISGNEMGVLLLDFLCKMRQEHGNMPQNPVAVKTIVTTPMAEKVAAHYGVEIRNVLTGFKFIGEQIGLLENAGEEGRYIFGFEESYGYLSGSFVRDKDAVNASLLICEMFAYYRAQGQSLVDVISELYAHYGHYGTRLLSYTFEGSEGFAKMQSIMTTLRSASPETLAGKPITSHKDYLREGTGLPKSNVLVFNLADGQAVIRPSGTEPKLKVYLTAVGTNKVNGTALLDQMELAVQEWVK